MLLGGGGSLRFRLWIVRLGGFDSLRGLCIRECQTVCYIKPGGKKSLLITDQQCYAI